MYIKKILTSLLAAGIILSLTACSGGDMSSNTDSNGDTKSEFTSSQNVDNDSQTSGMISQVFGKVVSVTGNEIKLSLAKLPEPEVEEESSSQGSGGTTDSVEMVPAAEAVPAQGSNNGGAVEVPKIQLEYTDEEQDFIIPAGADISGTDGQSTTMDTIKKGSVLMLNLDDKGNVIYVGIWE